MSYRGLAKHRRHKGAFTPKAKVFFRTTESHEKSTYRRNIFPGGAIFGGRLPDVTVTSSVKVTELSEPTGDVINPNTRALCVGCPRQI